jgi:putative toxin-antitoxin system antitoxin component (TIGR02293 family)
MSYRCLQNVHKFESQFKVSEESPSYIVLTAGISGRRKKNWLHILLNYEGIGDLKIPGSFITAVSDITEFPVNEVVEILDISRSTYYRIKDEPKLDPETADKISSVLKLFYHGLEAFEGSKEDFRDWLNTRIPNLGNNKPVELLKTESGRFAVQEAIGRIEFNVYG